MINDSEIRIALQAMHANARPRDLLRQLGILAHAFGDRVSPTNRTRRAASPIVGKSTQFLRVRFLALFLRALRHAGYKLDYLDQLRSEHIRAVVCMWDHQKLATRTLQTRLAAIRMLMSWMGLGERMPHNRALLSPKRWHARTVASRDKTWIGNGIDIHTVASWVPVKYLWIKYALLLMRHFGLRAKEAALLHPDEADFGDILWVMWGGKGGLDRPVPIRTGPQRELIDAVKAFVPPGQSLIGSEDEIAWREAQNQYEYVIAEMFQITREGAGATLHGLRAEYACELYQACAGEPAPIRGGRPVPREVDHAARLEVARHLGHQRTSVTSAYLGPVLRMKRTSRGS